MAKNAYCNRAAPTIAANVQPTLAELGKIWGVGMDYFQSMSPATADMGNFNAIQPWKITADGSVLNALV